MASNDDLEVLVKIDRIRVSGPTVELIYTMKKQKKLISAPTANE